MSKLIMVGLLVGSLFAGAVPALAQPTPQGGIGDPQTLAASGVLMPFFTGGILGTVATLQVASPVSDNPGLHMFFFNNLCQRVGPSVGLPLTTNDIAFLQVGSNEGGPITSGTNGLITIASTISGFELAPLLPGHPIHARLYQFSAADGRSRVIEPIILNTAEFAQPAHWWSPLRTGATLFVPPQTAGIQTDLVLICPTASIQGAGGAPFGADPGPGEVRFTDPTGTSAGGFPQIDPRFPATTGSSIRVLIFNDNEVLLRDTFTTCDCVKGYQPISGFADGGNVYGNPNLTPGGSYTELTSPPGGGARVTFTGYTSTFTVGSAVNAFFARFHNGSASSISTSLQGVPGVVSTR